jgi:hypothetical protein
LVATRSGNPWAWRPPLNGPRPAPKPRARAEPERVFKKDLLFKEVLQFLWPKPNKGQEPRFGRSRVGKRINILGKGKPRQTRTFGGNYITILAKSLNN